MEERKLEYYEIKYIDKYGNIHIIDGRDFDAFDEMMSDPENTMVFE